MYSIIGVDGNAFAVMGYVIRAMRLSGRTQAEIDDYKKRAVASTYENLLSVSEEMCEMLNKINGRKS